MNKHTKLAILIAPLLLVIGYIGSDYFIQYQSEQDKLFQLVPDGSCDILAQNCVLKSGEFKVNVFDKDGVTTVNTTFPLDSAILFMVEQDDKTIAYPLKMADSPYYWNSSTPLRKRLITGEKQKLRLIATIKGGQYISEFYSQVAN